MADRRRKKPKPKSFGKQPASAGGSVPPQVTSSANHAAGEGTSSEPVESAESRFERELVWCIERLQLGLSAPTTRAEGRQVVDAVKALKVLQSPNAPLVRKRQVMNSSLGDYRKKMADDERKYASNAKKMCLQKADSNKQQKSTFLRKSAHTKEFSSAQSTHASNGEMASIPVGEMKEDFKNESTSQPFLFNFDVGDNKGEGLDNNIEGNTGSTPDAKDTPTNSQAPEPQLNFYKMEPTGGAFTFNFPVPSNS